MGENNEIINGHCIAFVNSQLDDMVRTYWMNNDLASKKTTGCCKTTGKLWQHITETLYGVFLVFLGSFDCQIWAIFHFGTLWA